MARDQPGAFAKLAATYSDDVVTRARGGSLGGLRAIQLPSAFLDAIAMLTPGQTSEVISTAQGYHVLLWRNPPTGARVAGKHVVIRYRGTAGSGSATRTREQAWVLANAVLREARSGTPFDALVTKYSEADDRTRDGDLGMWMTNEPSAHPIVIEALAEVAVGEVVPAVLEGPEGFHIVKRSKLERREELSADVALFEFDPSAPNHGLVARQAAEQLIAQATRDHAVLSDHKATRHLRWIEGRGIPALTTATQELEIGKLSTVPVELDAAFAVIRRLPTSGECTKRQIEYDLPQPRIAELPLLESFVQSSDSEQLLYSLGEVRKLMDPIIAADEAPAVVQIFSSLERDFASADTAEQRLAAYRAALSALQHTLTAARYSQLTAVIQLFVSREMMEIYRP